MSASQREESRGLGHEGLQLHCWIRVLGPAGLLSLHFNNFQLRVTVIASRLNSWNKFHVVFFNKVGECLPVNMSFMSEGPNSASLYRSGFCCYTHSTPSVVFLSHCRPLSTVVSLWLCLSVLPLCLSRKLQIIKNRPSTLQYSIFLLLSKLTTNSIIKAFFSLRCYEYHYLCIIYINMMCTECCERPGSQASQRRPALALP